MAEALHWEVPTIEKPRYRDLLTSSVLPTTLPAALNRVGFRTPIGPFIFNSQLPGRDPIPPGLSAAMTRHKEKEHD